MKTPLSQSQFSIVIEQGRGKALMHATQFGIDGVEDLVLNACLNPNPDYSSIFNANWLFEFFKNSPQYESMSRDFLSQVEERKEHLTVDDYHISEQHWNITTLMALHGNKKAEKMLRDFVLNQTLGEHWDWIGINALYSLKNPEDAIHMAQRIGESRRLESP